MLFGGGEIIVLALVLGVLALGAGFFVFWVWMLIDSIRNESLSSNERIVWVLVIVLTHFLGALIYFIVSRTRLTNAPPPALPRRG
jgi:hypothetical protein